MFQKRKATTRMLPTLLIIMPIFISSFITAVPTYATSTIQTAGTPPARVGSARVFLRRAEKDSIISVQAVVEGKTLCVDLPDPKPKSFQVGNQTFNINSTIQFRYYTGKKCDPKTYNGLKNNLPYNFSVSIYQLSLAKNGKDRVDDV